MENHRSTRYVIFIILSSILYHSSGNIQQTQLLNLEEDVLELQAEFVNIRKDLRLERIDRQKMIDSLNQTIYQCTSNCKGTGVEEKASRDFKERIGQTLNKSDCNDPHYLQILRRSFQAEKVKRRELESKLAETEHKYSELVKTVNTFEEKMRRLPKHDYDVVLSKIRDVEAKLENKVNVIENKFVELASKVKNLTSFESKHGARSEVPSVVQPPDLVRKEIDPLPIQANSSCHVTNHCTNQQFPSNPCAVIVSRAEWGARDTVSVSLMREPVSIVFIHHTVTQRCAFSSICSKEVKKIQNYHMDTKGWDDIGYSFLVGEDGRAYEARGWDRVGAHTYRWNDVAIAIAVLGNFNNVLPSEHALQAINSLITCGLRQGKIKQDYKLYGQRDATPTDSPGHMLYNLIKTWPHYKNTPPVRDNN
uniref:Peptidoglycan recognition protein long n=1 Tax=Sinohyriopsis cumingii TaxID=165450 RepID=X2KW21_SINCU|nr:peptidoglycan recognition protein long [Sinohyriopsis cumingii]